MKRPGRTTVDHSVVQHIQSSVVQWTTMDHILKVRLSEEDLRWLESEAERQMRTRSWVVRSLIQSARSSSDPTSPSPQASAGDSPSSARPKPDSSQAPSTSRVRPSSPSDGNGSKEYLIAEDKCSHKYRQNDVCVACGKDMVRR